MKVDWEEVAYTIIFFTLMIAVSSVVFPITLIGRNLANPANAAKLHLFILTESVAGVILLITYVLLRVKKRDSR